MLYVVSAIVGIVLLLVGWQVFGPGPRRQRMFRQGQRFLEQGAWGESLKLLGAMLANPRLSASWQQRLRHAAGDCYQLAVDHALKDKRFEEALDHALHAAELLGLSADDQRSRVVDAMLAEVRRLFSVGTAAGDTQALFQVIERVFKIQMPCPEASFWQALGLVRMGNVDAAFDTLTLVHEQAGKQFMDPALYLGVLLHRQGKYPEALRFLSEANRLDGGCPFVTLQMGLSLVAGNGDLGMAVRALQRGVGSRGLSMWLGQPERVWGEAFPENKSYVRRLASRHPYACPLFGSDLGYIIRQGQFALAQATYRQGNYQESSDLYAKLLQDSPPTIPLLRGLGMSLARLGRHDQAYKHLRIALDQENPKEPFTAAYLALCGALGTPTRPEDKPANVAWGIRLLARFPVHENAEWAGIISAVFAEARKLQMAIDEADQLLLCDALASCLTTDEQAAGAYAHLARSFPDAVRPIHAWLYVRAACNGYREENDLDLFSRTFLQSGPARTFFGEQSWNFEDAEYLYLERAAAQAPGTFPTVLGPSYADRGESFLLGRSQDEERAGRKEPAKTCVEVLLRLAPANIPGHDRLACLHYRCGERDQAVAVLSQWERLAPSDHWPLVRQAIIEQELGNARRRAEAIDHALGLTRGPLRAAVAFLGARLALRSALPRPSDNGEAASGDLPSALEQSGCQPLLETCLQEEPNHIDALWCLAALRSARNDRAGLAQQAPLMDRPGVVDARFHFLAAVCHLAARDYLKTIELAGRAGSDESLKTECHFVTAWASLGLKQHEPAGRALEQVAGNEKSPSAFHARAVLGRLEFEASDYVAAVRWWQSVDPRRRAEWRIDEPLRQTVFLAGLQALRDGSYEEAAERIREAGRLGIRDARLGRLLTLALVRAGQRLLYEHSAAPVSRPASVAAVAAAGRLASASEAAVKG
jgi:tetratricopeptide (TPR) repeat protein